MSNTPITSSPLLASLKWRYAVKKFDAAKKIPADTWNALEESLVLTPSSFGLQPWKFLVITSPELKAKLPAISWNQTQPADCSHMVVFAARKSLDAEYVDKFIQKTATTRGATVESMAGYRQVILGFLQNSSGRQLGWASNQTYIALGQLMTAAALLGIDACPMEGIVASEYDKTLGLDGGDYTTVVACALGYRHAEDKYAQATKVRFDSSDVVQHL